MSSKRSLSAIFDGTESQRENQNAASWKAWHLIQVLRKSDIQYPCLSQHSFQQREVEMCLILRGIGSSTWREGEMRDDKNIWV